MSQDCLVSVGLLFNDQEQVLIAKRPGPHYPGFWEFPGGKIEKGESSQDALVRELQEELGIAVLEAEPLFTVAHTYPERTVILHIFKITIYSGIPTGAEGQEVCWSTIQKLTTFNLLDGCMPIVNYLQLEKTI